MKSKLSYACLGLLIYLSTACKQQPKAVQTTEASVAVEETILDKVAIAHGYDHWPAIKKIAFTFNVDRNGNHFQRSWQWHTKTNSVTYATATDSLTYTRNAMDSIAQKANAGFINDRYWLLAPFNLMWDRSNFSYVHTENEKAPLSGKPMHKLTIVYGDQGGYTPGDAYDFYFEDAYLIREWVFRKGNQPDASAITQWGDYKDTLGIKMATKHTRPNEDFTLYFDGILLETKD